MRRVTPRERWSASSTSDRDDEAASGNGQLFHGDLTNLFLMEAGSASISDYFRAVEEGLEGLAIARSPTSCTARPASLSWRSKFTACLDGLLPTNHARVARWRARGRL